MNEMQSEAAFRALAEKHRQQVSEIQRKREDLVRIQAEIKEKMGSLPQQYMKGQQQVAFATSGAPMSQTARQMLVYGTPSANIIRLGGEVGGGGNNSGGVIDMRPQFQQYEKLYLPPRPITIRLRTPPPPEMHHIDNSKTEENNAAAERWQQSIVEYYKDYNRTVADQFERNRSIERERNAMRREEKTDDSLVPMLKEQLEKNRQQSEAFFNKLSTYIKELNHTLEEDRRRRRQEREEALKKEKAIKDEANQRITTSTQAQPERDQTSTQVSLVDEARMRSVANRTAYVTGLGPMQPTAIVSGHPVYDTSVLYQGPGLAVGTGTGGPGAVYSGTMSGQASGPGVQVLHTGNGGEVIIAGVPQQQAPTQVQLKRNCVVTHTHDNPYVQSIISEIQQELDDIDRERRRLLIKERTKSAEQQLEKMMADLALEKERLCREIVSLARVNALLTPEGGQKSSLDPASTGAVADVLQLIKDQLRRICKIQSEANLVRHESVMTHLKTLWSHSDAHTVVEAAPQNPLKRIPAPIVPAPIPIDPPTYSLLPSMVLFYDFVCGVPNGSLTSVILNTSIIRRTEGKRGEEIIDLLVDLGELPPAGVSHASRVLDGVQAPGVASLPLESRGVAMIRYKHDLPQQFPADPCLFAMVTLGGQQAAVTSRTAGFARCLIPLVRQVEGPEHPATGRYFSHFHSHSNMFSHATLYYRLVRLEDAEAELRTWPVSLARMNLYLPIFPTAPTAEAQEQTDP